MVEGDGVVVVNLDVSLNVILDVVVVVDVVVMDGV